MKELVVAKCKHMKWIGGEMYTGVNAESNHQVKIIPSSIHKAPLPFVAVTDRERAASVILVNKHTKEEAQVATVTYGDHVLIWPGSVPEIEVVSDETFTKKYSIVDVKKSGYDEFIKDLLKNTMAMEDVINDFSSPN